MAPPSWEEDDGVASNRPSPPKKDARAGTYLSSESSASLKKTQQTPESRTTIDFRRNSSDSDMLQIPPVHQFLHFQSAIYDSDASDGSIVFSQSHAEAMSMQETPYRLSSHDRLPSFDSVASTGSFRLTGNPSPYGAKIPSPPVQTPVQLLPYDQRRKLLQKRQQQETQSQQQQQQQQYLHQQHYMPPSLSQQHQPLIHQHPNQQRHVHFIEPIQQQYPIMPVPYVIGPPIPVISGRSMHLVSGPMPVAPVQQQPSQTRPKPPKETISAARNVTGESKRKPPVHHTLPPSGHSRNFSGGGGSFVGHRGRTSSGDSVPSQEKESTTPHRQQRRSRVTQFELPPPPPPPPPPSYHIRTESSGSVSSLGSNGSRGAGGMVSLTDRLGNDIAGFLESEPPPQHGGFLGFFNLSPKPNEQNTNVTVEEFHQRNQAFLQRSEYERAKLQKAMRDSSPNRRQIESLSPRIQRHRPGLSSIDNDNWEEDGEVPPAQKGRTSKHSQSVDPGRAYVDSGVHQYQSSDPYNRYSSHPYQQQPYQEDSVHVPSSGDRPYRRANTTSAIGRRGEASSSSAVSSSDGDTEGDLSVLEIGGFDASDRMDGIDERTSLLPPSGISTHEHRDVKKSFTDNSRERGRHGRSSTNRSSQRDESQRNSRRGQDLTIRWDNRPATTTMDGKKRNKKKKDHRRRSRRHQRPSRDTDESDSDSSFSTSSSSFRLSSQRRSRMLKKERAKLIAQWKAEAMMEAEAIRAKADADKWHRRFGRYLEAEFSPYLMKLVKYLSIAETFICNLPLTIGAVALAIATLGVVWFKFAEENLDSCAPVHFHSSQCTFPEFPGCFYCDTSNQMYRVAVNFHFTCSAVAGLLAMSFMAKVVLATRLVLDEMSSPTTSSPAGLICMTTVCVFAGRGWIGQCLVSAAAALHLCLAVWFIYMALAYHIMPDPSWFPNTVGIGLSAVKTWLYYPMTGHLLMAISLSLNFFFFPISLIRVTLNKKISATVCWIQMSAPAISLYALTIMGQPSFVEEHPDVTKFQRVHRLVYLPCMHVLFALACIGVASSVQSLWIRWDGFRKKAFSPAHAAFCFPTLAHANAIQAYRAAVNTFSDIPPGSPFKIALYVYWVAVLVSGTLVTIFITTKFFYHLPSWTQVDVADEEEPPAPYETSLTLQDVITTGETLNQPFVSPAILQANETGALVMLPRSEQDGRRRFRRTRQLTALGFDPIMNLVEMDRERDVLLDWVGKNPPRQRKQTLSVPGIDFSYGYGDFGMGNTGVYGGERGHLRSSTTTAFVQQRGRASTMDDSQRDWR